MRADHEVPPGTRAARARSRAQTRAQREIARRHHDEYAELYEQYLAEQFEMMKVGKG